MIIHKINFPSDNISEAISALDNSGVEYHSINNVNWPDDYPYSPDVRFRIAHNGECIMLQFKVREEYVKSEAKSDNGPVWEDSCVEFFLTFDNSEYYNVECNCSGILLCGAGKGNTGRTHASQSILDKAIRESSLQKRDFPVESAPEEWTLSLLLPASIFFHDNIKNFSGLKARGNFYKCGDGLPVPHFLSWTPITNPTPNFHLPEFFKEIEFEK